MPSRVLEHGGHHLVSLRRLGANDDVGQHDQCDDRNARHGTQPGAPARAPLVGVGRCPATHQQEQRIDHEERASAPGRIATSSM